MSSSSRGAAAVCGGGGSSSSSNSSGAATGFPRISLRSLLLNGPFGRRTKARKTRNYPQGRDNEAGGGEHSTNSSVRRCAGLRGLASLGALRERAHNMRTSAGGAPSRGTTSSNAVSTSQEMHNGCGTASLDLLSGATGGIGSGAPLVSIYSTPRSGSLHSIHNNMIPQPYSSGGCSDPANNSTSTNATATAAHSDRLYHHHHRSTTSIELCHRKTSAGSRTSLVDNEARSASSGATCCRTWMEGRAASIAEGGGETRRDSISNPSGVNGACSGNNLTNASANGGGSSSNNNIGSSNSISNNSSGGNLVAVGGGGATTVALRECALCLQDVSGDQFPPIRTCSHSACLTCFKQYLAIEISESRVNITCPKCSELMHPTDIHKILDNSAISDKFEDFMVRRVLAVDPDTRWCPAPDCGYAVIAAGCASCPKLKCQKPGCPSFFCYHCKAEWHPNQTCDTARVQRTPHLPYSSNLSAHNDDDVKACPRCQVLIVKMDDGSCNHMTCSVCGAEFCWLCMKEVSDLHYLSPSGCTFWGKKPWSRKKKVLWQLGTLVGAPLGIALLAGLALPAIIIGIPIWAGKKIHSKYSFASPNRRHTMVVCGVVCTSLVSPIIAGVAVCIGVPILLAYVYGVVPISLCRAGGCGVITSAAGVRIAFDDEAENSGTNNNVPGGSNITTASAVTTGSGSTAALSAANFAMNSATAMRNFAKLNGDGIGMNTSSAAAAAVMAGCGSSIMGNIAAMGGRDTEADRESASNVAIAPPSLAGSIASASSSCFSPRSHKLEVHLEMGSDGCCGTSSGAAGAIAETASLAVSERSTNTLDTETASTRALAGSIAHYKEQEHSEVVSLVGVSKVAQAGDSASTVMDVTGCGDSISTSDAISGTVGNNNAAAAPSILSSISANTTTNLFIPPTSSSSSVATTPSFSRHATTGRCNSFGGGKRCDAISIVEDDCETGGSCASGDVLEGRYISGRVEDDAAARIAALHDSDLRLDSVSAIITARKLSAHSKGVTFSIGSASSHSRDHISLTLDDQLLLPDSSEIVSMSGESGCAVSGCNVSGVSESAGVHETSASAMADTVMAVDGFCEIEDNCVMRHHQKRCSDDYSSNENDLLVTNSEMEEDTHHSPRNWYSFNPTNSNDRVANVEEQSLFCKSDIGPHMDYREAYGDSHYDNIKQINPPENNTTERTLTDNLAFSSNCDTGGVSSNQNNSNSFRIPSSHSEHCDLHEFNGVQLHELKKSHQRNSSEGNIVSSSSSSNRNSLERQLSVPDN